MSHIKPLRTTYKDLEGTLQSASHSRLAPFFTFSLVSAASWLLNLVFSLSGALACPLIANWLISSLLAGFCSNVLFLQSCMLFALFKIATPPPLLASLFALPDSISPYLLSVYTVWGIVSGHLTLNILFFFGLLKLEYKLHNFTDIGLFWALPPGLYYSKAHSNSWINIYSWMNQFCPPFQNYDLSGWFHRPSN